MENELYQLRENLVNYFYNVDSDFKFSKVKNFNDNFRQGHYEFSQVRLGPRGYFFEFSRNANRAKDFFNEEKRENFDYMIVTFNFINNHVELSLGLVKDTRDQLKVKDIATFLLNNREVKIKNIDNFFGEFLED